MGFLPCITSMLLRGPCSCRQGQLTVRHHAALHGGMVSAVSSSSASATTLALGKVSIGKDFGQSQ